MDTCALRSWVQHVTGVIIRNGVVLCKELSSRLLVPGNPMVHSYLLFVILQWFIQSFCNISSCIHYKSVWLWAHSDEMGSQWWIIVSHHDCVLMIPTILFSSPAEESCSGHSDSHLMDHFPLFFLENWWPVSNTESKAWWVPLLCTIDISLLSVFGTLATELDLHNGALESLL